MRRNKGTIYRGRPGWIYVVRIFEGPTKIGLTFSDPFDRVAQVDRAVPFRLDTIGFFWAEDAGILEEFFHDHFSSKWVKGEWFNLAQQDIEVITKRPDFKTPE